MTTFPRYGADVRAGFFVDALEAVAWADAAIAWREEAGTLLQSLFSEMNASPASLGMGLEVRDLAFKLHDMFKNPEHEGTNEEV